MAASVSATAETREEPASSAAAEGGAASSDGSTDSSSSSDDGSSSRGTPSEEVEEEPELPLLVREPLAHTPINLERFRELLLSCPLSEEKAARAKAQQTVVHVVNSTAELDDEVEERWTERDESLVVEPAI